MKSFLIALIILATCASVRADTSKPAIPQSLHRSREITPTSVDDHNDPCGVVPAKPIGKRISAVAAVISTRADADDHSLEGGKTFGLLFDDQSPVVVYRKTRTDILKDENGAQLMFSSPTRAAVGMSTCTGLVIRASFVHRDDGDHIFFTVDQVTEASSIPEAEAKRRSGLPGVAPPIRRFLDDVRFDGDEAADVFHLRNDDGTTAYFYLVGDKTAYASEPPCLVECAH
jgi:hypothetical protein